MQYWPIQVGAGNADDLLAAIANGEMTERAYPVGTQMAWMGAKVKGEYVAKSLSRMGWIKNRFEAFQLKCVQVVVRFYHIAIPKACCNVSLISVAPDQTTECQAPVAAVVESAPEKASLIPYFGLFAGSETRARYEPAWDMDMLDSSGIVGARFGLMKSISDKTSVFGQLSYYDRNSINEGNVYPENNLALDIGLERRLSETAFIGGGIGVWNIDESDYRDTSLFGHVGGDIGQSNLQWFLEGRVFDSDSANHGSLSENKMFSAGVRYLVK